MKNEKLHPRIVILTICTFLTLLFIIFTQKWILIASLIIGFLGIFSSKFCQLSDFIWNRLSYFLSLITSNLILSSIYVLVLTPLALFSRFFNKDTLRLSKKYKSTFIERVYLIKREDFEKTW